MGRLLKKRFQNNGLFVLVERYLAAGVKGCKRKMNILYFIQQSQFC